MSACTFLCIPLWVGEGSDDSPTRNRRGPGVVGTAVILTPSRHIGGFRILLESDHAVSRCNFHALHLSTFPSIGLFGYVVCCLTLI